MVRYSQGWVTTMIGELFARFEGPFADNTLRAYKST